MTINKVVLCFHFSHQVIFIFTTNFTCASILDLQNKPLFEKLVKSIIDVSTVIVDAVSIMDADDLVL